MNRELKLQVNKVTMENVNQQKKKYDGNQQHEEKKRVDVDKQINSFKVINSNESDK